MQAQALSPSDAAWLDDPQTWPGFGRQPRGTGSPWESELRVEGMHCAACALAVEDALRSVPGVLEVQVGAASRRARVRWDPARVRPSTWLAALERAGYRGVPVGGGEQAHARRREARLALWRWLVAGLVMMQVMMYAVPAYLAAPGDITADDRALLHWASWVLCLPLLLFSCGPFFAGAWRDLRGGRIGMDVPVALGIVVAFVASMVTTFDPAGPLAGEVWYDSLAMFVFFLLSGRMLEQRLRERTAGALESLIERLPASVERRAADGAFERVALGRLQAGDLVRVLPGAAFPGDGRIAAGQTEVDEALLTGEARPLPRGPGDAVVAGSHNLQCSVEVRLERVGADTRHAGIVALMQQAALDKPRLAQLADRLARPFLLAVLLAAGAVAAWWWPGDPAHAVTLAIAVLVVTCPCALSLATPAATLAAAGALARRGILVRRLQALEALAGIDTVVFDKTGTLTEDGMALGAVRVRAGGDAAQALRLAAALARHSLHPAARALVAAQPDGTGAQADGVREFPGQGLEGSVRLPGAAPAQLRLGSAAFCSAPARHHGAALLQVHLADAAGWMASFDLDERLRAQAAAAVQALAAQGLRVQLLSGDREASVARLARRAGIDWAFAERSPEEKLDHVRFLQQSGHRVAMVGDGLNDAPVLALADVSVAMGQAVPLAQTRADVAVPGSRIDALPVLVEQARRTRRVVRQNLAWAAAYNGICVPLAILGWMPPWLAGLGMAASSLLVILNAARLAKTGGR